MQGGTGKSHLLPSLLTAASHLHQSKEREFTLTETKNVFGASEGEIITVDLLFFLSYKKL